MRQEEGETWAFSLDGFKDSKQSIVRNELVIKEKAKQLALINIFDFSNLFKIEFSAEPI